MMGGICYVTYKAGRMGFVWFSPWTNPVIGYTQCHQIVLINSRCAGIQPLSSSWVQLTVLSFKRDVLKGWCKWKMTNLAQSWNIYSKIVKKLKKSLFFLVPPDFLLFATNPSLWQQHWWQNLCALSISSFRGLQQSSPSYKHSSTFARSSPTSVLKGHESNVSLTIFCREFIFNWLMHFWPT